MTIAATECRSNKASPPENQQDPWGDEPSRTNKILQDNVKIYLEQIKEKKAAEQKRATTVQDLTLSWKNIDLQRLMTRKWRVGEVYAPHDLSSVEMRKLRSPGRRTQDAFDALALNPLDEYKVCQPSQKSMPNLLFINAK
jgi:small subunit ribosomal protein S18